LALQDQQDQLVQLVPKDLLDQLDLLELKDQQGPKVLQDQLVQRELSVRQEQPD
jgi:hypothetical protein